MNLLDFLLMVADANLKLQNKDGFFPAGHNGPYFYKETPLRNSSHWLITLSKCHEITGDKIYLDRISAIAEYLYSDEARPYNHSFYNREKNAVRDQSNGLIGQAWVFEALEKATKSLGDMKYALLAKSVFLQHSFNEKRCLWNNMEINGQDTGINWNFNQQVWFAASSASVNLINNDVAVENTILKFLDNIFENMIILPDGLIYHYVSNMENTTMELWGKYGPGLISFFRKSLKKLSPESAKRKLVSLLRDRNQKYTIYRSTAYHSFILAAFGLLKTVFPGSDIWSPEFLDNITGYVLSKEYIQKISKNKFGFPYNVTGFEIPYAICMLSNFDISKILEFCSYWINQQINRCFNKTNFMMDKNTTDPLTLTARIYEITRLPEIILNNIEVKL
jgi:hypothetical protein